jgi:Tol biopolymer transport system component/DNA-binding winged helix-turn-helix (wHTH) protein
MTTRTKQIYEFGPFRIDAGERVLLREGRPVPLTPKAFDVLLLLVESSGHIVEKDALINRVWANSFVEEGNLKVTVSILRKALEESAGERQFIETVPRRGYRFTADVRALLDDGPELILLERSRAHVIIEEEEEGGGEPTTQTAGAFRTTSSAKYLINAIKQHRRGVALALLTLLIATAAAGYGFYRLFARKSHEHFQTMKLKGLTSSGTVLEAGISPDGKYVVYSVDEGGQESLWLRQIDVTANNILIARAADVRYQAATFSADGNYVYYVESDSESTKLFRAPVLGGASRKLLENVGSPISCSPDGKQIAFLRGTETNRVSTLMVANMDGTGERQLAAGIFTPPSWSPDGRLIACGIEDRESIPAAVMEVRVEDGQKRLIHADKLWVIRRVAWLGDSSGLIAVGQERNYSPNQLWYISHPAGEVRRITNDLNDYRGVSLTADSSTMATVRTEQFSSVWVAPSGDFGRAKQITPGLGNQDRAGGLCWTPDGQLVFESSEAGIPGIWITAADGTGRRQLSDNKSYAIRPTVSPDGRYVVFASGQSGDPNIWRMNIDGSSLKRLTNSTFEAMPYCSPDSRWVVYTSLVSGASLWKVPMDGGEPEQLTSKWARGAVISPDGKLMVGWYRDDQQSSQIKIGVFPVEGGEPIKVFPVRRSARPPRPAPNYLRWTADGSAVLYLDTIDGVSNIWSQPLNGGPPTQVTDFKSDRIFSFDWSKDGKRLALARGRESSDIVVITDFK